jgi:hypothetical protein
LERTFESLEAFQAFENPKSKEIRTLSLSAHSKDHSNRATIRFGAEDSLGVLISLEGEESSIVPLSMTTEQLYHLRPWYWILTKVNLFFFIAGLPFLFVVSLMVADALGLVTFVNSDSSSSRRFSLVFLLGFSPLALGLLLYWVRKTIFPTAVFAIGQGVKRHRDLDLVRNVIVIAFVVSIAASIVAAWLV